MILGIGTDLADITRVEKTLSDFGDRFRTRLFTPAEQAYCERKDRPPALQAAGYAKLFAAKEACSKALGTGMRRGVFWRDMEVCHKKSGQPCMKLSGGARARLLELTPEGAKADIHLSLSDEPPQALAFVTISLHLP